MSIDVEQIHPDLVSAFIDFEPRPDDMASIIPEIRAELENRRHEDKLNIPLPSLNNISYIKRKIPTPENTPEILIAIHKPSNLSEPLPALLWMHGGGYIRGDIDMDVDYIQKLAKNVGCMVVSVEYRLAPENPFPAPLEDCYTALKWLFLNALGLGVDSSRIAIGGVSGGGGLAAALALLARDRDEVSIIFQLLLCPMIDNRNSTPSSHTITDKRVVNRNYSKWAWSSYLGKEAHKKIVSPYAVPSQAENLSKLPPAYVAVGALDLFMDENINYAQRLLEAGVSTELHVFPGAYHAFEFLVPEAEISQSVNRLHCNVLKRIFRKAEQQSKKVYK